MANTAELAALQHLSHTAFPHQLLEEQLTGTYLQQCPWSSPKSQHWSTKSPWCSWNHLHLLSLSCGAMVSAAPWREGPLTAEIAWWQHCLFLSHADPFPIIVKSVTSFDYLHEFQYRNCSKRYQVYKKRCVFFSLNKKASSSLSTILLVAESLMKVVCPFLNSNPNKFSSHLRFLGIANFAKHKLSSFLLLY